MSVVDFAALRSDAAAEHERVPQPPPEHTTRDPWPDGFDVPRPVVRARRKAEAAGWTTRVGYSRAFVKTGRGYVRRAGGKPGSAAWARHHFVGLQVRRPGSPDGVLIYRAPADGDGPLSWKFHSAMAGGRPCGERGFAASLTSVRSVDTVST